MKKLLIYSIFLMSLFILSCSSPLDSKYGSKYGKRYNMSKDNTDSGGIVSPPDDPGFEEEVIDPITDPFNDTIEGNPTANNGGFNASKFEEWRIIAGFDGKNVPSYKFSGNGWNVKDAAKHEYTYAGANSYAGGNSITGMTYYQYRGFNYFYERDAPNTAYHKEGGHGDRIKRFYFYRFTGKGGGVASLDNLLMAVDSYSKLVFGYGKPLSYTSILGNQMPTSWGVFDLYSSGPGGKKYKFYEYDPIGYVKEDGTVVLYDWFVERQGTGNYECLMAGGPDRANADFNGPGKSPYITEGSAGSVNLSEVVGTLTVQASYIKNVSVTDTWGDAGVGDGTDRPEFIFNLRSAIYTGFDAAEYVNMADYKSTETTIMPSGAYPMKTKTTLFLSGTKGVKYSPNSVTFGNYDEESGKYVGCKKEMYLALDMRLVEIDISGNDWVSDYEMPLITMKYDRDTRSWVLVGDNGLYYNGKQKIYYDKTFSVKKSQTRTFSVLLDADSNDSPERMEVGFKISFD